MIGTRIAHRYRVLKKLGQGGLGAAYRVRDEALDRDVCLKLLAQDGHDGPPSERAGAGHARLLRAEFETLRGLVHPHLARVHDFGVARDAERASAYFTSELAPGGALGATAWGKPWTEVAQALAGPLGALGFLHERGLCHGDFKPDNVLVDPAGASTLIDLSCAARLGARADLVSGTRGFIAPEVLRGEVADERADLFAVGVTLAALAKVARGVPREVERLVDRLTRDDPAQRPGSVGEVLDVLGIADRRDGAAIGSTGAMFGRVAELARFDEVLRGLLDGDEGPRLVVVRGADGAGKSRFIRELKWSAEPHVVVVEGFAPRSDAVRSMLSRACEDDALPASAVGALRARDRIVARGSPVVLLIDDADACADAAMLDAFLRSTEPRDPTLVVLTEREPRFSTASGALVHELAPLSGAEVGAWLAQVHLEAHADHVMAATSGHPAAVARAVQRLQQGVPAADLERALSADVAASAAALPREPSVQRALGLLAASLEPIEPSVVVARSGASLAELPHVSLRGGGIALAERAASRSILSALPADVVRWAHRELAAELARAPAEPRAAHERAARRVWHLISAGEITEAESLFEAELASRAAAPRAWLDAAAAIASASERPDLRLAAARAVLRAGEPRRALGLAVAAGDAHDAKLLEADCSLELGHARQALEAARAAGASAADPLQLAASLATEARAHLRLGAHREALAAAKRGLAHDPQLEVSLDLHECAGAAAMFAEDYEVAAEHLAQIRRATLEHDPRRLVRALSYDAILAFRRGDLGEARQGYERALEAAEQHAIADQIARASLNLATACHQRGELAQALAAYERGERLARALEQTDLLVVIGFNLSKLYADAGALDRAFAKASSVKTAAAEAGASFFVAAAESVLAEVAACRGDIDEARRRFTSARDGFAKDAAQREVAEEEIELGHVALLLGATEDATRCLDAVRAFAGLEAAVDLSIRAAMLAARIAMAEGEPVRARRALGMAAARAERAKMPELQARALAQLADVASAQGLVGESAELAVRVRAIWSAMAAGLPSAWHDAFWRRPERARLREPAASHAQLAGAGPPARVPKLERLLGAFRKLNSSLEAADVLAMAMDEAIELTGAERGFVVLDVGDGRLDVPVARNVDRASLDTSHLRFSRGIAEQAITTAAPVITIDAQSDDRFRANVSVHAMRLRSVLAVPIRSPDGVLGALYLDNRYAPARFEDGDADLLLAFADQVAIALRNARLVEVLRRQKDELAAERARVMELARGQAVEIDRLQDEVNKRQAALEHRYDYSAIVGRAPALQKVFAVLDRVIDSPLAVLVSGESGTGKELVARAIHYGSGRKAGPFVGINCAALPASLLESELFGHVKGAFTGAERERTGLVVAATGGTLFLDELGEMPLEVQAKLLRVLQEKEVRPLGGAAPISVDFRLVCATNRDLLREVAAGRFREDLYYRVGVVDVRLPPLRERLTDLPELTAFFVKRAAEQVGRSAPRLTPGALKRLAEHDWPGNVRELENVLTKAVVLADGLELTASDVETSQTQKPRAAARGPGSRAAPEGERAFILSALEQSGWNAVRAARDLGMPRATFYRRLRALGVERPKPPSA